ncbi:MAG: hypothetical protein WA705_07855 [Candidatus Ozemobacteraceae bacterium]
MGQMVHGVLLQKERQMADGMVLQKARQMANGMVPWRARQPVVGWSEMHPIQPNFPQNAQEKNPRSHSLSHKMDSAHLSAVLYCIWNSEPSDSPFQIISDW